MGACVEENDLYTLTRAHSEPSGRIKQLRVRQGAEIVRQMCEQRELERGGSDTTQGWW